MSDVQFDGENNDSSYRQNINVEKKSKIFKFVESFGVPEGYVNYVLIGFVIIALLVSIFLLYNSTDSTRSQTLTPIQQSQLLKIMPQDISPVMHY